jgi:single-strand DNA-binding protein
VGKVLKMNNVILMGRMTRKPEINAGEKGKSARFTLAVNRRFKNKDGQIEADFIPCVVFGKTPDFVEKYFDQGSAALVTGRIQTGNYTNKEGQKVYTTDVIVSDIEFAGSKSSTSESAAPADEMDEELPFN